MRPIERLIYRLCRVNPATEQTWIEYAVAMLLFSIVGMVVLYAMERLQFFLPLNPQSMAAVPPDLAFNTAASFTTNTNWQAYARRIDHELLHADGRARLSQFRLGGGGNRGRYRGDSRLRPAQRARPSAISGSI